MVQYLLRRLVNMVITLVAISVLTFVIIQLPPGDYVAFSWIVAIPVGIYAAVRQYSPGDYAATFASFVGLAIPNF